MICKTCAKITTSMVNLDLCVVRYALARLVFRCCLSDLVDSAAAVC